MELQPREPQQRLAAAKKKQAKEEELKRWIISTRARLKSNPAALAALGLGWGTTPRLPEETKGLEEKNVEKEDESPQTSLEKQRFQAMMQATKSAIAGMEQALDGQYDEHAIRSALNRLRMLELGGMNHSDHPDQAGGNQPAFAFMLAQFDRQVRAAVTIQHAYRRYRPPPRPPSAASSWQSGRSRSASRSVIHSRRTSKHSRPTTASRYMDAARARSRAMRKSNPGDAGLLAGAPERLTSWRSRFNPVGGLTSKRLSDIGKLELMPSFELPRDTDPMQRIANMCAGAPMHSVHAQEHYDSAEASTCGMHTEEEDNGVGTAMCGTHMQKQCDSAAASTSGVHTQKRCGSAGATLRSVHIQEPRGSQGSTEYGKEQLQQDLEVESEQELSEEYDESMAAQESPPQIDTNILLEPLPGQGITEYLSNMRTAHAQATLWPSPTARPPLGHDEEGGSGLRWPSDEYGGREEGFEEREALADHGEGAGGIQEQRTGSDEEGGRGSGGKETGAGKPLRISVSGKGPSRVSMAGGVRTRMLLSPLRFATFKPMDKARRAMQDMLPLKRIRKAGKISSEKPEGDGSSRKSSSSYDTDDESDWWHVPEQGMEREHSLLSERLIYRDNLGLLKDIAGYSALGEGGIGAAIQKQVAMMVSQLQVGEAPVRDEVGAHLERIQSLINSAAKLTAAHEEERLAIINALGVELERLKPCMSPQPPPLNAPHEEQAVRDAELVWRRQQRQQETKNYEAIAAAAAAENEAIAARFAAVRKAAEAQLEEEDKQAARLAEATARAMEELVQGVAAERLPSPNGESSDLPSEAHGTPGAPPATPSHALRLSRTPSLRPTEKGALQRRQHHVQRPHTNSPLQSDSASSMSPWTRTELRTHSRMFRQKSSRQPMNREPLYKAPARGRGSSGGHRILPSTRSSRAQMRLAQARIARELRNRKQVQWANLHLHEEAWAAEGSRGVGGMQPYMLGMGSGGAALAHFVLDEQQGLEERIKSMVPIVSHLSLKARASASNLPPPPPPEPQTEPSLASRPPAFAHLTRQYSTLSPAQPLSLLSQPGFNSSTSPEAPAAQAHHSQRVNTTAQRTHAMHDHAHLAQSGPASLGRPPFPTDPVSAESGGTEAAAPRAKSSAEAKVCHPEGSTTATTPADSAAANAVPHHSQGGTTATPPPSVGSTEARATPGSTQFPQVSSAQPHHHSGARVRIATPPQQAPSSPATAYKPHSPSHQGPSTAPLAGKQQPQHSNVHPLQKQGGGKGGSTPPQGVRTTPTTASPRKLITPAQGDPCASSSPAAGAPSKPSTPTTGTTGTPSTPAAGEHAPLPPPPTASIGGAPAHAPHPQDHTQLHPRTLPAAGSPTTTTTTISSTPNALRPPVVLLAQQQQKQQWQQQQQQQRDLCSEAEPTNERLQPFPTQQQQQEQQQQQPHSNQTQQTQNCTPTSTPSPDIPDSRWAWSSHAQLRAWGQRPSEPPPYQLYPIPAPTAPYDSQPPPSVHCHSASLPPPNPSHHLVSTTLQPPMSVLASAAASARAAIAASADSALPKPRTAALPTPGYLAAMEVDAGGCHMLTAAGPHPHARVPTSSSWPGGPSSPAPTAPSPLTSAAYPALNSSASQALMRSNWPGGPSSPTPTAHTPLTSAAYPALNSSASQALMRSNWPGGPSSPTHTPIPTSYSTTKPATLKHPPGGAADTPASTAARHSRASGNTGSHLQASAQPNSSAQQTASQAAPQTAFLHRAQLEATKQASRPRASAFATTSIEAATALPAGIHTSSSPQPELLQRHQQQPQPQSPAGVQAGAQPRLPQLPRTPPRPSKTEQPLQQDAHRQEQLQGCHRQQQNANEQQDEPSPLLPPLPTTPNPTPRGPFPPQMPFIPSPPPSAYSHTHPHAQPPHTPSHLSRTPSAPSLSSANMYSHQAGHSRQGPYHTQPHQAAPQAYEIANPPQGLPRKPSPSSPACPDVAPFSLAPPPTPSIPARAWVSVMRTPPPGLVLAPGSPTPPAQGPAKKRRARKRSHPHVRSQQQEQEECGSGIEEMVQQQQQQQQQALPSQRTGWQGLPSSPGSSVAGHRSASAYEQGLLQGSAFLGQLAQYPPASSEDKKGGIFQVKLTPGLPTSGLALWYLPGTIRSSKRGQAKIL